jgi:hypothetical protein
VPQAVPTEDLDTRAFERVTPRPCVRLAKGPSSEGKYTHPMLTLLGDFLIERFRNDVAAKRSPKFAESGVPARPLSTWTVTAGGNGLQRDEALARLENSLREMLLSSFWSTVEKFFVTFGAASNSWRSRRPSWLESSRSNVTVVLVELAIGKPRSLRLVPFALCIASDLGGRAILLGLEFLVAGDIIRTVVVAPTLANVVVLALIVLIRTFLSVALELELEGHWPWARSGGRVPSPASDDR